MKKLFHTKIIYLSDKVYNFYLKDLGLKKKHLHKIMSPTDTNFFKRKKFKKKKSLRICTISGILNVKDILDGKIICLISIFQLLYLFLIEIII